MNQIGKFRLESQFKLMGRGLVLIGQITEGKVKIDSVISFIQEGAEKKWHINGVEMLDYISKRESAVGLVFNFTEEIKKMVSAHTKIEPQIAIVYE